jgi:2-methylisocitrate lyase-like PEP mutase family enzyme
MTAMEEQKRKAEAFRAMHRGPKILLLLNVWDVAGARIFGEAGLSALATTSAGIAFAHGYRDGQKISRQEMLAMVARIAGAVPVPVTADVEAGYGDRAEDAALTARAVIASGAVGMNLEDGSSDATHPLAEISLQLEKIAAVREAAATAGIPLVLNARTDVYLKQVGAAQERYGLAVERLAAFREAGADCVFAPGLQDRATIGRLAAELRCPLNILAGPGTPSVPELEELGVARVSVGSAAMRATLGLLRTIARELRDRGTYDALDDAPTFAEVNRLMP